MKQPGDVIRVPLLPPIKGVNRAFALGNQPDGTCWDALNVVPTDHAGTVGSGRFRITSRASVVTQIDLDTDDPVRLLHTASTANSGGSSGVGGPLTFTEPFTYSNGVLTGNGTWLDDGNPWVVSTNRVTDTTGGNLNLFSYNTAALSTFNLGAGHTITCVFIVVDDEPASFAITAEGTPGGSETWNVIVDFSGVGFDSVVRITDFGGDIDNQLVTLANGSHTLEVTITSGRVVTVKIDTVTIATGTVNAFNSSNNTLYIYNQFSSTASSFFVDSIVVSGFAFETTINRTATKLVAVSGTTTFFGNTVSLAAVSNSGSFPVDADSVHVSAATLFGKTYIVDGTQKPLQLNLATPIFEAFVESAGTAPDEATIAVAWRGRLVLSGEDSDPQNIFASRVSDPLDWDYGQDDAGSAWAANLADAGRVGEPVLALIPMSDDLLVVGCEQSMWVIHGDPGDGGSIDKLTDSAGIHGPNAWCRGPNGDLYWVGTRGFYRCAADGSNIDNLSRTSYPQFFAAIQGERQHVNLIFDSRKFGVWVYVTPENPLSAPLTSIYLDANFHGLWPIRFTNIPEVGPLAAVFWDGLDTDRQYPLLGGYDGIIYRQSDVGANDKGSLAIDSYVTIGPLSLSILDDATVTRMDVTGGDQGDTELTDIWNMAWTVKGGRSARDVMGGTPRVTATGTFSLPGRQLTQYPRVRGGWFTVTFSNSVAGSYFSYESGALHIIPSGMQR